MPGRNILDMPGIVALKPVQYCDLFRGGLVHVFHDQPGDSLGIGRRGQRAFVMEIVFGKVQ